MQQNVSGIPFLCSQQASYSWSIVSDTSDCDWLLWAVFSTSSYSWSWLMSRSDSFESEFKGLECDIIFSVLGSWSIKLATAGRFTLTAWWVYYCPFLAELPTSSCSGAGLEHVHAYPISVHKWKGYGYLSIASLRGVSLCYKVHSYTH